MTKEDIVLMLLASGPKMRSELVCDTGWSIVETKEIVERLASEGKVVGYPDHGSNQFGSMRLCLPALRVQTLASRKEARHAR